LSNLFECAYRLSESKKKQFLKTSGVDNRLMRFGTASNFTLERRGGGERLMQKNFWFQLVQWGGKKRIVP